MARLTVLAIRVSIALVVLVGLPLMWLVYDIQQYMATPISVSAEGLTIKVESGSNLTRIVRQLHQQQILTKPRYVLWYARWTHQAARIQIGEYKLNVGATPRTLLDDITNGNVIQYSITLVEGWTFEQILSALDKHEYIEHTIAEADYPKIMGAIGGEDEHPEGRFMPDTYHFPKGEKDLSILKRAYQAMRQFLEHHWKDRDVGLPIKTPYEGLILASIVEKETGLSSERKAIAGVFSRRLHQRMRLQSDPTVIYGMGKRYKGNIRRSDLETVTPYNTYRQFGLPPTPIAMPGREAIMAVLHPEEGDALYFVSKGDGSHYFSATLDEHNRAVIQYQLKGRNKPFSSYKTGSK